jgi:transcription elongation factor GreA
MQIPKRKPGRWAGQKTDPHLTRSKYRELEDKLERLKKYSRPRAADEVRLLASDGDFSDNAPYAAAKARLRGINRRIDEIEDQLKQAVIIDRDANQNEISIGSRVRVEINGRQKTYEILGSAETDPARGIISHKSPIGQALLGQRPGETVKVKINGKTNKYKIIALN